MLSICRVFYLLLICVAGGLVGCASTTLVDRWDDPTFTNGPLKEILVLAVMETEVQRRLYEDLLAKRISTADATGIAGYTVMPQLEDYDDKEKIRAAVKKTKVDGVILARLIAVEKEERYVPPTYDYTPFYGYGYGLYDYYGLSYQTVFTPGYITVDTVVKLETTVFSTVTEKMIWAGITRSFNPSSTRNVANQNADLIVTDMKKSGLL
ncbi:MAG: hypothetical protein ACWGOX_10850 [Desulforhopalus sp.]